MTSSGKGNIQGEGMVHHPAQKLYLVTLILLVLMILFGFIAVFVPWVMKDIAVGTRAWAYPFKTCLEDTFSKVNAETCMDNDFIVPEGVPLTGKNNTCKTFVLATIAFVFISVIGGVLTLLALLFVILKLWSRPVCMGIVVQIGLILVCVTAILSWIMFICYAETTCAPNSIFPVQGYSYGFILYIFASTFALGSVISGFLAFSKMKNFVHVPAERESEAEELVMELPPANPDLPNNTPQNVSFNV